jgi:hypothetical protein
MVASWRLGTKLMPSTSGIVSAAGSLKNPAEPESLGYRVNYIPNPSFEVNTTGWVALVGATLTRTETESVNGDAAAQVVTTAASGFQWGAAGSATKLFYSAQGSYRISAYIKAAEGAGESSYSLRYFEYESQGSSSTVDSGTLGTTSISSEDGWVRISGTFTRTVIANNLIIRIFSSSTTSGHTFYVDSVLLENVDTLGDYFDGSDGGFWTGTPHQSISGGSPY